MQDLICVFGSTGQQGGAVLRYFAQQEPSRFRLRGVTRDVHSRTAIELQKLGVVMVIADLDDKESVKGALTDATYVFATTDSNRTIFEGISKPESLPQGETARSYAYKKEIQQGKNLLEAASASSSLQALFWSSLASPKKWSNGQYSEVSMWDAKEEIAAMLWSSSSLHGKLRTLILGFFMTNALNVPHLYAPEKTENGVYELALPMCGDTIVPVADLETDMGRWVEALLSAPPQTILVGASVTVSWTQWLQVWGETNGVPVQYRKASLEEFGRKVEGISEAVLQEFQFIDEFGFVGGMDVIYPELLRHKLDSELPLLGQTSGQGLQLQEARLKELMASHDWEKILK